MITLPQRISERGAEARLLLAECRGPSFAGYSLVLATKCMQLMDLVLWNRVKNPGPFLAKQGTLLAVITAPGQFQGFQHYPHYANGIAHNLQQMVDIANSRGDKRAPVFADYVSAAIRISVSETLSDPSPGMLVAWRTAASGSPGPEFAFFTTVLGTSFYYMAKGL